MIQQEIIIYLQLIYSLNIANGNDRTNEFDWMDKPWLYMSYAWKFD